MQDQEPRASAPAAAIWADLRYLAILAVIVIAVRAWQIAHTEVTSRDSITFIRTAWQLEHNPWNKVMPSSPQHPGYPLAVYAMSLPLRQYFPDELPRAWQISAQLVSALASLLLLVPMFYFGCMIFDRRIAFWACLLFQCLPTSGKIMGDGLSDPQFILFACTGLWLAGLALRRHSTVLFGLAGLACGLAYLTRPEGAVVLAAAAVVLLAMQLMRPWRQPWRKVLLQGVALSLPALAVMAPYMLVIGGLTVKNTPNIMMKQQRPDADWQQRLRPQQSQEDRKAAATATGVGATLLALFWGPGERSFDELLNNIDHLDDLKNAQPPSRYLWAFKAFAIELGKGFFYVTWLPILWGVWWYRSRFLTVPGVWVGALVCLILSVLLFHMAEKMGYLSDRHFLLLILCGSYWIAAGALRLGEKLAVGAGRLCPSLAGRRWTDGRIWSLSLLLLLTVAPLPRTMARLHAERAGFRPLGQWLAENTLPGDFIEDPYRWAYFYAGRVFVEGRHDLPMHQPSCFYVILEASRNRHPRLISLQGAIEKVMLQKEAKVIHTEDVRRGRNNATLQVWQVPGPYQWKPLPALPSQRN